ncbi:sensor histidine kinase [Mycolicibacterium sphagni]|uniref:sensor histidine kinase n=1 Tax=Mycolicibacterium sphagni TaxID=1786 RepID=UPI0021F30955|nr:HAMP domain-containing sensor histidine kinase [Mycolicibacterium sphagni]MCV7175892.1 HAMP domain-containing histidine kinase [Mycolicibacterium sphagni]
MWRCRRPRSLRRRLVLWVSAIVSVALVGVGAVAVMSLRDEAASLANSQVSNSLAAFSYSYAKAKRHQMDPPASDDASHDGLVDFPGQAPGTVIAMLHDGVAVYGTVFTDGEPVPAPAAVLRSLESIDWRYGDPQTVGLPGLGSHRVGHSDFAGGERLISAVSLDQANKTVGGKVLTIAGLVVLTILVAALGTVVVVNYALRPLRRVAAVAGQVAAMPLDSTDYRISTRVGPDDTDPGSEIGVVGHTLNRLLANVDAALNEIAGADRRTRQFLTDASHELRTPLAAILGYAELTRQDSEILPPTTEYALARIEAESRRMTSLVADLLLLSRLDEGLDLELEELDLCDVVADAVNDVSVTAPDHRFVTELPDHAVWVRGDRARLHQLLGNLLSNARVHTPAGVTVTTSLSTCVDGTGTLVELVVGDDGPGIPDDIMPNLFGRFVRADKSRSRELGCSGLGLAIVLSIVEAHSGTVCAESRPGRTVFTVQLPAVPATTSGQLGENWPSVVGSMS